MEQLEGYISSEARGSGKISVECKHFFPLLISILAFLNVCLMVVVGRSFPFSSLSLQYNLHCLSI